MSRKLPRVFAHQFLPEFFFADPEGVLKDLFLEKKLRDVWQLGAEELREFAIKDAQLSLKPLFWRGYRASLIELVQAQFRGEPRAAILAWREATRTPYLFFHEKADFGWALTSISKGGAHHFHAALEASTDDFINQARETVAS